MNKRLLIFAISVIPLLLPACDESAEPIDGADESKKSELTAEEVYEKATDASEEMESAHMTMDMDQTIDSGDGQPIQKMESHFDVQMTTDPLAIHMDGTNKLEMDGEELAEGESALSGSEQEMEIYLVEDTIYVYSEPMGGWIKLEDVGMETVEELGGQQPDPSEKLEMIEAYTEDLSFKQSDDAFILTLDADGEEFNELSQQLLEEKMPDELMEGMRGEQSILDRTEMNEVTIEMSIDKDTFDLISQHIDMDMSIDIEGEEMNIKQNVESSFSNINHVDLIEIPEEAKANAISQ